MSPLLYGRAGDRVPLIIDRNGERLALSITPTDYESAREQGFTSGGGGGNGGAGVDPLLMPGHSTAVRASSIASP